LEPFSKEKKIKNHLKIDKSGFHFPKAFHKRFILPSFNSLVSQPQHPDLFFLSFFFFCGTGAGTQGLHLELLH
jgi:hypothetical protein